MRHWARWYAAAATVTLVAATACSPGGGGGGGGGGVARGGQRDHVRDDARDADQRRDGLRPAAGRQDVVALHAQDRPELLRRRLLRPEQSRRRGGERGPLPGDPRWAAHRARPADRQGEVGDAGR